MPTPKPKTKPRTFTLHDPIYQADIIVSAGTQQQLAANRFGRLLGRNPIQVEPNQHRYASVSYYVDFKGCLIWFRDPSPGVGVLTHEAFHATRHVLTSSGVGWSEDSEEAWAYFIEWLVKSIGNKLW